MRPDCSVGGGVMVSSDVTAGLFLGKKRDFWGSR
jgi:hypothetical protein